MIRHKFLIGDVLKKVATKKLPLKAKTLPKTTNGDKSLVPLMAAGVENQGCVGYVKPNEPTVLHNLITVSANGANSGATFYQQRKFSILQDAYALELVDKYADYAGNDVYLYLTAVVDHRLKDNGYNNKATWNRIKRYYIELPVTPSGDPDFEYMTMRIRELEAERIRELEAYLRVTGLDDTTLSASEARALTQKVQWKKFRIGDVFEIHPTKAYKLTNRKLMDENGKTPVLTNTSTNNGIGGWSNLKPTEKPLMITYSDTTTGADTVFVQTKPFIGYSHVQGLYSKINHEWTIQELLYIAGVMKAAIGEGWSYATKLNREIVSNLDFMLPVTSTGDIDFDYIQNYIRATEKQTIKGVVEYKDRVVEGTKKIVNE